MYGRGGRKLEINIPLQQIYPNGKGRGGGFIIKGGVISSEYSMYKLKSKVKLGRNENGG